MRILHIGLASFFTEGMTYQDNQLVVQNCLDGHDVMYISNASKYENGKIVKTIEEETVLECGAKLVRLKYKYIINEFVSDKIRSVKGLYTLISDFKPDVILSHDLCYYSVKDVISYVKEHREVIFFADTHTAIYNSGTNWLSLNILHKQIYKRWIKKALPYVKKYFYVGNAEKDFSLEVYRIPENKMQFWPLGTNVFSDSENAQYRQYYREKFGISDKQLLFMHSGKLTQEKKTEELLDAFYQVNSLDAKLIIIGLIPQERKNLLEKKIARDKRVSYIGWKSGKELREILCASDLYCQPGSVSATLQNAIGSFSPIMSSNREVYESLDYGQFLWCDSVSDMIHFFEEINKSNIDLSLLREKSRQCAMNFLDYKIIARELY